MHFLLDDETYVFELEKWMRKLNEYLENLKKTVDSKKELGANLDRFVPPVR